MTTQTTQSASDLQSKVKELTDEVERLKEELERAKRTPTRERLPQTRRSITHKFSVAGHEGYITVGMYPDGRPAELFITMAKEGSTIRGLMDSVGILASMALQYGVPVQALANKLYALTPQEQRRMYLFLFDKPYYVWLRPEVKLLGFVRKDLWDRLQQRPEDPAQSQTESEQ